jgi:hypothetical protein
MLGFDFPVHEVLVKLSIEFVLGSQFTLGRSHDLVGGHWVLCRLHGSGVVEDIETCGNQVGMLGVDGLRISEISLLTSIKGLSRLGRLELLIKRELRDSFRW